MKRDIAVQNIRQNSIWAKNAIERKKSKDKEEELKRLEEEERQKKDPFGFDQGFKSGNSFIDSREDIVNFVYDREKKQFIEEHIRKDPSVVRNSRGGSSKGKNNNSR